MPTAKKRVKKSSPQNVAAVSPQDVEQDASEESYPIVGVGASAGGLAPFLEMLRNLPEDPGLAIIYVLHQEKHDSALVEVIARATKMPVIKVQTGLAVAPNRVYVAHADSDVVLAQGRFNIESRSDAHGRPIDTLLLALAEDQGSRSIGVLLSGSGSDGTLGAKAIKAEAGITFAQDETAQFQQMAQSAITAGSIDFVLPAEEIARELVSIARHARGVPGRLPELELKNVFSLLLSAHDVDFTHYKPSTIERRIRRRLVLHKIDDLRDYVKLLRRNPPELEQLYNDILIRVTSFFRDPEVFDALARNILPAMARDRRDGAPIRIWVPGCATGEEVYSIAIVLSEIIQDQGLNCAVQIFGTDVSDSALDHARQGIYGEVIAADVSPERLRRFFSKVEGGYRVSKALRDCCVFARQNLTKDPPFSRLDLITCRNLMIYLDTLLQRKVMSIFHYALSANGTNGYLLLGSSETIGNFGELFQLVDRRHKIYRKKPSQNRVRVDFDAAAAAAAAPRLRTERVRMEEETSNSANVFREADRVMLSRFSPKGVLINESMEILQFRGRTSLFLEPPAGVASFNVLKMAREGLLGELRAAIHSARKKDAPVRREGVRVRSNGRSTLVNIEVVPFTAHTQERFLIILFEEVSEKAQRPSRRRASEEPEHETRPVARLKRELEATREYLQSIIEEQEAMNEELRSANEEIQSSNEELQSTNEELETAKEELQSSNEELTTLNEELENRNQELAHANNDLVNLLASVDLPIVMLDSSLRIRRFNPGAQRTLNLIGSDVGRAIGDLKLTLVIDDLDRMIADVIDTLEVREMEVRDRKGQLYLMRIRPYKTTENKIEGAVMVLIDIEALKKVK